MNALTLSKIRDAMVLGLTVLTTLLFLASPFILIAAFRHLP
jgi:hypothetical protein